MFCVLSCPKVKDGELTTTHHFAGVRALGDGARDFTVLRGGSFRVDGLPTEEGTYIKHKGKILLSTDIYFIYTHGLLVLCVVFCGMLM